MDPYIEQVWGDFHTRLMGHLSEALNPILPPDLRARVEERIVLESLDSEDQAYLPDVQIYQTPRPRAQGAPSQGTALMAEPLIMQISHQVTERFVRIIDVKSGGAVVTLIEVLSPTNKRSGRREYLEKQKKVREARINLVEIDLIHGGESTTLSRLAHIPPDQRTPYHTSVYRAAHPDQIEYYRMPLKERLPRLPIPLRTTDADAVVDLQPLIDHLYESGGYDDIDYDRPLDPPLPPDDAEWAQALIRSARP